MIILYHPKAAEERFRLPMSLLALASVLPEHMPVHIVDGDLRADPVEDIAALVNQARGFCLLAVTVMPGPQLSRAIPHCRALRQRFPDMPIVWGGWFPSLHADTCLASNFVDYVLRGRAEVSFPLLIERLMGGLPVDDIPGLSYAPTGTDTLHVKKARTPHPDKLPVLPYHLINPGDYHCDTWLGSRTTAYHSSYGCPLECGFCAVAAQYNGQWVGESIPTMMKNLEVLLSHGANAVEFCDNNFFVGERRTVKFANAIHDHRIQWWGEGTVDDLIKYSDRSLSTMRDAGLRMVFMGAESGSDVVLKTMNKGGLQTATILKLAKRFGDFDIVPEFSFVLGNPPNPVEDIEASIKLIRAIKEINPFSEIILYIYAPEPYPGSTLWEEAQAAGFSFPQSLDEWEQSDYDFFNMRRQQETPWLGRDVLKRIRDFETVLHSYYPSVSDTRLGPFKRRALRAAASLRYQSGRYGHPYGLKALLKLARHRRIEIEGIQAS